MHIYSFALDVFSVWRDHPQLLNWLDAANGKLFVVFDEAHHAPAPSYRKLLLSLREHYSRWWLSDLS
jgi:superfamily II DNA or RNA helicase